MCGIVAVAGEPLPSDAQLTQMRDTLAHRGPDDATSEMFDGWVALGFRRLAIIDLEGARQPLRSEDGQVACIFNGEIYNFASLRKRLRDAGHVFATAGDGEVIVHGYEEWGDAVFGMLEGMFAIALVDRARRRFLIVRDRFGIKPLFYTRTGNRIAAASEIKALLPMLDGPVASRVGLALGSARLNVPWPYTAFEGIYRLPPGCFLERRHGSVEPRLVRFAAMTGPQCASRSQPEHALDALRSAVARQMVADVPVGAFLSGGIDSTLIVALMREVASGDVHTFTIRTREHDESDEAEATAHALGTIHHTIDLEDVTFEALAELPRMYDEPFAETSALGVRALSRFARDHVKVALSGDGGDEVFGGYGFYRWIRTIGRVRPPGRAYLGEIAYALLQRRAWPARVRQLLRITMLLGDAAETAARDVATLMWAAPQDIRRISEELSAKIQHTASEAGNALDPARRAMLADRHERLPNAMLSKIDIASMSAGLEVRVPMLDDALVRYAETLPTSELLGLRWGKLPLRRELARTRAGGLAWAKKRGFTLPLDRWINSPAVAARFEDLFRALHDRLEEITGENVIDHWERFRHGGSRFSSGTAAQQLLWFASVALWADRYGVRTARDTLLPAGAVA